MSINPLFTFIYTANLEIIGYNIPMRSYYMGQFIYRLLLLAAGAALYLWEPQLLTPGNAGVSGRVFRGLLWVSIFFDALKKFFPSEKMSMGCRKVFSSQYKETSFPPASVKAIKKQSDKYALSVAVSWILFNLVFFFLFRRNIIGVPELMLLVLLYFLADMICILFFCPFRLMMRTKCCTTCRIFNWDSMMLCTPFIAVGGLYGWSLTVSALAVLIFWEVSYAKYPCRFFEQTNAALQCINCEGRLCGKGGRP